MKIISIIRNISGHLRIKLSLLTIKKIQSFYYLGKKLIVLSSVVLRSACEAEQFSYLVILTAEFLKKICSP